MMTPAEAGITVVVLALIVLWLIGKLVEWIKNG